MIDLDALTRRIAKLEKQLERAKRENKDLRDSCILARKRENEMGEANLKWQSENFQLRRQLEHKKCV